MPDFSHLHVHTQYSLLDGAAPISGLLKKAQEDGQKALAITDHGNMFGVFDFVSQANKLKFKAIVGCEFYMVEDRHIHSFKKSNGQKDLRYHQLLLAKNAEGYSNISRLCSLGYIEGLYGKYPRIDKELIQKYHNGLIATSCCLGAEIPKTIYTKGTEAAEEKLKWWIDLFGEDYFIEIQRHGIQNVNQSGMSQEDVNQVLIGFAKKYNLPIIATNDSHYLEKEDFTAHDILLCVNTGEKLSTPKRTDEDFDHDKKFRFGFANDEFYFKSTKEMNTLFQDIPESIDNTNIIVDRCEILNLKKDILLPEFIIPTNFTTQDQFLRHITYDGAKRVYPDMTPAIQERIDFELETIEKMGFAGYFLIVSDFIKEGRNMGVSIGPGRGSAAGSAVAYCTGITTIDPIAYDLLFERFLNPDRKSMPDIDTDFEDDGRQKVIDYVVQKYGKERVAHIVTYGTMASKSSIKDVARVLDLPLKDSIALTKLVPDRITKLKRLFHAPLKGTDSLEDKENVRSEDLGLIEEIRKIYNAGASDPRSEVLHLAEKLEGSVRGTGIHAAGIIIAPVDLIELLPVAAQTDLNLLITQYEGNVIEDAGVIKMDFLGLRNLSIIKECLRLIKQNTGIDLDIDKIDLKDAKTFELYQKGETNGTFQFESAGMQKYLKELKPDQFLDLIAMNALYRPGPLAYIPDFILRKNGLAPITYDLPEMEEILKESYGITVYQEQVMLLSQKLGGFSKGDADKLRKGMGKKDMNVIAELKPKWDEGTAKNGFDIKITNKIWNDWLEFAKYAFNKSHSTCYAFVAFQTGYLKAHYPSEYMAAVLSSHITSIEKISFFMEECKRMGMKVLGPDINESGRLFEVNKNGEIRFGLAALKGTGDKAVECILEVRENGPFKSVYDFASRVDAKSVNKRSYEAFAYSGAFDCFPEYNREDYFHVDNGVTNLEKIMKYGMAIQAGKDSKTVSLFGAAASEDMITVPKLSPATNTEKWSLLQQLNYEKDVVGIYMSAHPLMDYSLEIDYFTNVKAETEAVEGRFYMRGGIITDAFHYDNEGKKSGKIIIEDHIGKIEFRLRGEDYLKYKHLMEKNQIVWIKYSFKRGFNSEEIYSNLNEMVLLDDIIAKMTKEVTILLNAVDVNTPMMDILNDTLKTSKGRIPLYIKIYDESLGLGVKNKITSFSLDANRDVMQKLTKNFKLELK